MNLLDHIAASDLPARATIGLLGLLAGLLIARRRRRHHHDLWPHRRTTIHRI
jgi:LPXTG-motif cell wall-anchored protein